MKARIKATGEILEILDIGVSGKYLYLSNDKKYSLNELEFLSETIDLQQVRIQFISAALTGLLANPDSILNRESIVEAALKIADALIAELQKKGGE